jgi:hypothetical protein
MRCAYAWRDCGREAGEVSSCGLSAAISGVSLKEELDDKDGEEGSGAGTSVLAGALGHVSP